MVIWEKYVKKYVWDERSTPFLVPVKNLNQAQARKELFLFAIFLATPFALLSAAAGTLALQNSDFGYAIITFFAVSIVTAAGYTNHAKKTQCRYLLWNGAAGLAGLLYPQRVPSQTASRGPRNHDHHDPVLAPLYFSGHFHHGCVFAA